MEIQVPLILFVAFCAASAGLFASQALLALKDEAKEAQMPSLIASLALLAIGGIAVLFHLAQPLHIFNGFGNPTSGITQEFIVIIAFVAVMLVYFIMLRRNDNQVPKWCAILAIAVAIVLDFVCAHSYMMDSRPAWNSLLQVLSVIGASFAFGPAAIAAIAEVKKSKAPSIGNYALIGTIVGLVTAIAYIAFLATSGGTLTTLGTYIDPTNPTAAIFTDTASVSPFAGAALVPTCVAIIASVLSIVFAWMGKSKGNWKVFGIAAALCALIAAIALRVTFYILGLSVYNFYGIAG